MAKAAQAKEKVTKIELRKRAIAACKDERGRITPAAVIAAARNPKSPLHNEFEWDVQKAANHAWTETARRLIREVQLLIIYEDKRIIAPFYISSNDDESAYVETTKLARKNTYAKQALTEEIARIKGAVNRGMAISAVFNMASYFERMLDLAIEAERFFQTAGDESESSVRRPSA